MRTEYLDNKINELETLRSRGELTYMGGEMLSEFNEIKRALSIAPVSERNYTKEQMIAAAKYGYEYHESTSYPDKSFNDNCKNNTEQWIIGVIDAD